MVPPDERERIRRAYYIEKKSIGRIAQEEGHCRETIRKALAAEPHTPYLMKEERPAPNFKPHQARVEDLLVQNDTLPRKQRYTAHRIFEIIRSEGYTVLIVEQNVSQVLAIVDRAYLIEAGRIKLSGSAAELGASDEIRKAYLGI